MKSIQRLRARLRGALILLAAAAVLSGCSWLESLDVDETRDWSASKLYDEAHSAMKDGDWTRAKDYYTKLESRYPFGSYAQQSQLELAYCDFKDDDPTSAVQTLDRFLKAYPNHQYSDYALYLKGVATLNENDGFFSVLTRQDLADRDAQAARDAFDVFKELAARYPDSRYAARARRYMHELVLAQARHEINVSRFYYVRHAYVAAINRAKPVLTDFQHTPQSDEAMQIIADSYHQLKLYDLEKDMRRVIELNKNRAIPGRS